MKSKTNLTLRPREINSSQPPMHKSSEDNLRGEKPLSGGTSHRLVDTKSSESLLREIKITIRATHALIHNLGTRRLSILGNRDGAATEWVTVGLRTHHAMWERDNRFYKTVVRLTAGTEAGLVEGNVACAWRAGGARSANVLGWCWGGGDLWLWLRSGGFWLWLWLWLNFLDNWGDIGWGWGWFWLDLDWSWSWSWSWLDLWLWDWLWLDLLDDWCDVGWGWNWLRLDLDRCWDWLRRWCWLDLNWSWSWWSSRNWSDGSLGGLVEDTWRGAGAGKWLCADGGR